ncbi:MAG: hypothetical protein JNN26_02110 [Candidatus Obscuribacter sp.]|nr:hypothetical protein [Candidatus Obscuribacter sp.]
MTQADRSSITITRQDVIDTASTINRFGELILSKLDEFIASELAVLPPGSNPSVRLAKKLEKLAAIRKEAVRLVEKTRNSLCQI